MARTFPKHVGKNFDAKDYSETASGYVWAPLRDGRLFETAEARRVSQADRRSEKAFKLHIGQERFDAEVEGAGIGPRRTRVVARTLTPQDLTDDELAALAEQLNTQVRETNANAKEVADQEAAEFASQKAAALETLTALLASVVSANERGLDLLKARVDIDRALTEWKNRHFRRAEFLQDYKATGTLELARDEVNAELRSRRAARNAKQAELKAMLAEAGIHI